MANELQINANRLNAEKSTGPSTIEGKLKSSQNALRHGMLAQTIVLEGESSERFQLLLATLVDDFGPRTAAELALVETMAVARWRQMRLWAFERVTLSEEILNQNEPRDPLTRSAIAFRTLSDTSRSLELINRYEARYERQYCRAQDRLIKLLEKDEIANRSQFQYD